jgi:hypothetical protein
MGGARYTRYSFARTLIRRAVADGWVVSRERFDIDGEGRGTAVFRVDAQGHTWRLVAFSQKLTDDLRTDRVIADAWDVTGALVEGDLDDERLADLAVQVPLQEAGRADPGTIIWTRANRSARFFDYVVDRLSLGLQPESERVGSSPYVLRSTAFYSNGKFGLADFERFAGDHPFAVPYRAHMLTAWLLRELSYDLVEHVAARRSDRAARLTGPWRRYLGVGNATGLGMVPYVVTHPGVLDAWAQLRERPLASVLARTAAEAAADWERLRALLDRATEYLASQTDLRTAPYLAGPDVAEQLSRVERVLAEFGTSGTIAGTTVRRPWQALHDLAAAEGPQCRGVVASLLTELTDDDAELEDLLRVDEAMPVQARMTCRALLELLQARYGWIDDFDFGDPGEQHYFWFFSRNSEEPRRARHDVDPGEEVQHNVDVARLVAALRDDLRAAAPTSTLAEFLLGRPGHRQAVSRVQTVSRLTYGEVHDNLVSATFLPLNVQRFQLAVYGMENYSPQSTDWLRVTLFSGAPRTAEIGEGTADDDWIFTLRPRERTDHDATA